jgi:hypothetical protein
MRALLSCLAIGRQVAEGRREPMSEVTVRIMRDQGATESNAWPWKALTSISVRVEGAGKTQVDAVSQANEKALAELDEMRESFGGAPAAAPVDEDSAKKLIKAGRLQQLNAIITAAERFDGGTLDVNFVDFLKKTRRELAKVGES